MSTSNGKKMVYAAFTVSLICIIGALVSAIIITGHLNAESTPIVSGILGLVGIAVPALVSMFRSVENRAMIKEVDRKVNGHLSRLTDAAINAGVKPEDLPPLPPGVDKPGR